LASLNPPPDLSTLLNSPYSQDVAQLRRFLILMWEKSRANDLEIDNLKERLEALENV